MEMKEIAIRYIENIQAHSESRRKIRIAELEDFIKVEYADSSAYQRAGGYGELCGVIAEFVIDGLLEPVKSAKGNGRQPELRTMYWSQPVRVYALWSDMDIVRVSDRLYMTAYIKQPELQTDADWQRIEKVYEFLGKRDSREWATREERSLELFGSEKWLSEEQGMLLLRRIGMTLEGIKAKVHGEPFVFWPSPGISLKHAKAVLVVENLSLFHTVRRVMELDGSVLNLRPDLLIYGEGKKIEASMPFLNEITKSTGIRIMYAGDIDPEGWGIYIRLKQKHPSYEIGLALPFYEAMVLSETTVSAENQKQDESVLQCVLEELNGQNGSELLHAKVNRSWIERLRVPQEVLTVETLRAFRDRKGGIKV
jgi:hypothetical protein